MSKFSAGLSKTAAITSENLVQGAKKVLKSKGVQGGAIAGAATGAVQGALSRDEQGNRQGFGGAVKGAIGGAAVGGATGAVLPKVQAYRKMKQTNPKPPMPQKTSAATPVGPDTMVRSTGPDVDLKTFNLP